jgi:hypothetical protein
MENLEEALINIIPFTSTLELVLNNNTEKDIKINSFNENSLFRYKFPNNSVISSAFLIRENETINIKKSDCSTKSFVIKPGETSTFQVNMNGLFSFGIYAFSITYSFRKMIVSMSFRAEGEIVEVPKYFLGFLCYDCDRLTVVDFNTSQWKGVKKLNKGFLLHTWKGCTSLTDIIIPDTSEWSVNDIGENFMGGTFYKCKSLKNAVMVDTSNWTAETVREKFMMATWRECISLVNVVVPDTTLWKTKHIEDFFLSYTWMNCKALVEVIVPDVTGWPVTNIGDHFLYCAWQGCSSIITPTVLNTSNWRPTSIGKYFLSFTWNKCPIMEKGYMINTSNWPVTSVGDFFMDYTWADCPNLDTVVLPDARQWKIKEKKEYFLYMTFKGSFTNPDIKEKTLIIIDDPFEPFYITGLKTTSGNLKDEFITFIQVHPQLVEKYKKSKSWSNISNDKFKPI